MSKLLPGSMPMRFICAMIGSIGDVGRLKLEQLGRVGEIFAGRHGIDLNLRRRLHVDARVDLDLDRLWAVLPHSDSGVTL